MKRTDIELAFRRAPPGPAWSGVDAPYPGAGTEFTPAAVLCPIVERRSGLFVHLVRRSEKLRRHAGQESASREGGSNGRTGTRSPLRSARRRRRSVSMRRSSNPSERFRSIAREPDTRSDPMSVSCARILSPGPTEVKSLPPSRSRSPIYWIPAIGGSSRDGSREGFAATTRSPGKSTRSGAPLPQC